MQNKIEGFRLSPQQRHVWRLSQDNQYYRAQCVLLLGGNINAEALEQTIQKIVARHEILRTNFRRNPGISYPIQLIGEGRVVLARDACQSERSLTERRAEIEELARQQRSLPFDFEQGPLLHASLVKLAEQTHLLLLCLPALCADARTLRNLSHEIGRSYGARIEEDESPEEPVQYVQFSEWQNELLEDDAEPSTGKNFWRQQKLASYTAPTLPFESRSREELSFEPRRFTLEIGPDMVARLDDQARACKSSSGDFLLACWQTLLWRLTAQPDIIVGKLFAGRKYDELEEACGLFATRIPIVGHFAESSLFSEVLKQLSDATSDASAWQEYFDWEDESSTDDLSLSGPQAASIGFDYEEGSESLSCNGISFTLFDQYFCAGSFKIKLNCVRKDDSLVLEFHYDANVFDATHVKSIAGHFLTLVESAVANPQGPVSELEILTAAERTQLLSDFNRTAAASPLEKCIYELFEEQVARTPDQVAVVFEDERLTYAQLNARANQLAHYLRDCGVGADVCVGLCVERSLEMIVGMLGILKAGGAYAPLDPEQPRARLQYQLDELDTPVLLTQKKLLARLPDFAGEVVCLDESALRFEDAASTNPERRTGPQHLAYVIYTSGSTGSPKGVAVTQRNLVNYTTFICRKLLQSDELTSHKSLHFATVSTITADLGNTCIFPSLISGGCLHVLSYEVAMNAGMLANYLYQNPIDVLKIVPSHFSGLLNSQETDNILPRKFLILGGEALSFNLLERISKLHGACKLINHYGPTESTVGSLTFDYSSDAFKAVAATVPVGRPIANTQVYILNRAMQPQPVGVAGELYIGGDGLARGYLKQAEQTAEKFVANPFSNDGSSRLYRTGDLARFLPDGEVEFIGRIDQQVKVRGYRIEPGEIEAELRQHPEIREALVIARDEAEGHKRLVAYVVGARHSAPTTSELRDYLGQRLPAYMIPSAFVTLKSLPVTRNGKVDRRALPEPEQIRPELERSFIAASNEIEETLAAIWCQVLGLEKVGRLNNFFELGGDSILSLQIVARANRAGLRLTPKQLFENPTIGELAAVANTTRETQFEQGVVTGSVPLTPVQRRFFERELPDPDHWNMAVMLEVKRELKRAQLGKAVEHLLAHHDALRMSFAREESGWIQSNNGCGDFAPVTQVDLSSLPERERIPTLEAVANTFQASLDLSDGRPLRFVLFNLGGWQNARLLVIVHHLVMDGVSWRILLEDLETACDQLAGGEPVEFARKTASFKQWAERLTAYAQSAGLRRQLAFWTDEARPPSTRLPRDFADGNNSTASALTVNVELGTEETRELLQDVPVIYNTQINDVLLAALALAFKRWTGESATLVELEGHGREEIFEGIDLSRTVGWFTTHFPVLLRLPEPADVSDSVKAVKEQLRAIPERGIGYGVLRHLGDEAQAAASLRSLPQPEVSFNYLGQFDNVISESSLFALATESVGTAQSLKGSRGQVLRINAGVTGGQLRLALTYSENLHRRETIEQLAQSFVAELRAIIAHRPAAKVAGYTPSDFPQADINQQELDRLAARIAADGATAAPGELAAIEDVFPLSPIQEGMLFHSASVTDSDPYFRQLTFMLRGDLNLSAFATAWQSLITRHPTLRTSFFRKDLARPHQVVRRNAKLPLAQFDWRELPLGKRAERLDAFLQDERTLRFELTQSPLMRLSAIRVADDAYQLVWSYHHLIMDAWSRSVLFKEFLELYEAHAAGSEVVFEPSRSYSEYVAWLRRQDTAQTEAYWRKTLKGLRGATVPRDDASEWGTTAADERGSGEQEIRLSAETTAALQTRAREHRLTLNTFVQGAWALLLGRYSGETDVVFGTVVSGRPVELAAGGEIIGLFINTLPRRVRIEPEQTVLAWLQQLQTQQVELGQYEHSSLVQVQAWSDVPRGKSLFECVLNFGNAPVAASLRKQRQGLSIGDVQFVEQSHYPLALEVAPGVEMSLRMLYAAGRFNSAIIGEMLKNLEDLLREMSANPVRPVRELWATKNDNSLPAALLNEHLHAVDAEAQFVF
jgi:amino acid adenylation domain-containing protein/non-ribosomal peptide synthase protein (TIGR01720 family)